MILFGYYSLSFVVSSFYLGGFDLASRLVSQEWSFVPSTMFYLLIGWASGIGFTFLYPYFKFWPKAKSIFFRALLFATPIWLISQITLVSFPLLDIIRQPGHYLLSLEQMVISSLMYYACLILVGLAIGWAYKRHLSAQYNQSLLKANPWSRNFLAAVLLAALALGGLAHIGAALFLMDGKIFKLNIIGWLTSLLHPFLLFALALAFLFVYTLGRFKMPFNKKWLFWFVFLLSFQPLPLRILPVESLTFIFFPQQVGFYLFYLLSIALVGLIFVGLLKAKRTD